MWLIFTHWLLLTWAIICCLFQSGQSRQSLYLHGNWNYQEYCVSTSIGKLNILETCIFLFFSHLNKLSPQQRGGRVQLVCICIYIIIIMSCCQHGYPWPSLATPPYRSLLLAVPQGYILYPHTAAVYRFELVVLLLLSHVLGSIGEHHLWARPCFSSSVLHVWFVLLC